LLPALILLVGFLFIPALWAVYLSFTDRALTGVQARHYNFIGFENYANLFQDSSFYQSLWLTLIFVFLSAIVGQFMLGLLAALILNRKGMRGDALFSAAILLPLIVPETIAAYAWGSMLASGTYGVANKVIGIFGLAPVDWLQQQPMASIIVMNIWRGIAFAMIIFLAALQGIQPEILEAAAMDGAGPWQRLIHITLPLLRYAILLYMLLTTIFTFGIFGLVYVLTAGGPGTSTQILGIYIYQTSFRFFELGYGSAAAVVTLLIALVLGLFYVRVLRTEGIS
ncbi:MAG TPA: sugar ABC transporter permease, partial [Chloroflexota bacterium]|nr:sugar ABC transporter permease [Chloroflexota bacterium]